jgi:hypothetical protein
VAVYLFFDESGNLDFSGKGTKFFAFGCLTTRNPGSLLHPLAALRYQLLEQGVDLECFHAAEDRQSVRNMVFAILAEVGGFEFDAILIEKSQTPTSLHDPPQFYPRFARDLLTRVFQRFQGDEKIILVTDRPPLLGGSPLPAGSGLLHVGHLQEMVAGRRPILQPHQTLREERGRHPSNFARAVLLNDKA